MKSLIRKILLLSFLMGAALAIGYGYESPGSVDNVSPIDNVSPMSSHIVKSTETISIIEVVPADKDEYLILINKGKDDKNMTHWSLSIDGRMLLSLPPIIITPNTRVGLHIGDGNSTDTEIYLGYQSPVLGDTGRVGLLDENGSTVVEMEYP